MTGTGVVDTGGSQHFASASASMGGTGVVDTGGSQYIASAYASNGKPNHQSTPLKVPPPNPYSAQPPTPTPDVKLNKYADKLYYTQLKINVRYEQIHKEESKGSFRDADIIKLWKNEIYQLLREIARLLLQD
jgi:hypothetical protein